MEPTTPRRDLDGQRLSAQPYLDWAVATGFVYLRPGAWLPLLVEFDPAITLARFTILAWLGEGLRPAVRVPELFAKGLPLTLQNSPKFNFCVLLVDRTRAAEVVRSQSWNLAIRRSELGPPVNLGERTVAATPPLAQPACQPQRASSVAPEVSTLRRWARALVNCFRSPGTDPPVTPPPSTLGQRVVVAVIDRGIAFAHSRFSTASGTRIACLWQQDNMVGATQMSDSPGAVLSAADIDLAVQNAKAQGSGEDRVYRTVGGMLFNVGGYNALARRRSHGTHVLDLAAGWDPNIADMSRPIIAVDMPDDAIADPAGATLAVHAMWGLVYIMTTAECMRGSGETLPVVVNISYGPHEGPHDGTGQLEVVMDHLIDAYRTSETPLRIVLAAGNYRQSRAHANFELQAGATKTLQWRLQPAGLTPSFMEIWLAATPGAAVNVTLISPQGLKISVSPGVSPVQLPLVVSPVMLAEYVPASASSPRAHVSLVIAPTALDPSIAGGHPVAASGLWSVEIKNASGKSLSSIDAWIKRSDTPGNRRAKGRQSYFDNADYARTTPSGKPIEFDPPGTKSYVRRQGTLSGIATGIKTYVIGAYRRGPDTADLMPADYSSEGPVAATALRTMRAPNWLAPGDDGVTCPGVLSAGTRSGARVAMRGTSVAAPQATRYYANEFAKGNAPGPASPGPLLRPSKKVPSADVLLVAGDGLMLLQPPVDRVWKERP
jgi:Subtilase family